VVRPARLGALLQSVKDTPRTWQDRVPSGLLTGQTAAPRGRGLGSILTDKDGRCALEQKSTAESGA
jgi:hypothetical protein